MSFRIEEPKILTAEDMFDWWCKQKIRKRRHLRVLYRTNKAVDTILVSSNGDELKWLKLHVEVLKKRIEKLGAQEKDKVYFTKDLEEYYRLKRELSDAYVRIDNLEKLDPKTRRVIMGYKQFRKIICEFNKRAGEAIKRGKIINPKNQLGYLYVQKLNRGKTMKSRSRNMINWPASHAFKKELIEKGIQIRDKEHPDGKNWLVYFTDDWYLRFHWTKKKGACHVKNGKFYNFKAASILKRSLAKDNKENPFLHREYVTRRIYYPKLTEESQEKYEQILRESEHAAA